VILFNKLNINKNGNYTKHNRGGVVIRTSSQRWFNALGSSHIDTIKIYQTESGQTSSTLLKSFNVNITNSTQLIQIKIPNEDMSLRIKSLEIVVEDNGNGETYSWMTLPYLSSGGWIYLDLLE
jgi:hypothetical protein